MWGFELKGRERYCKDWKVTACMHAHVHTNTQTTALNFSTNGPQWVGYKGGDVMSVIETVCPSTSNPFLIQLSLLTQSREKERTKRQNERQYKWTSLSLFIPFLFPTTSTLLYCISIIKTSLWFVKCAETKIATEFWLFKHLTLKSADLCFDASNFNIIAYKLLFWVSSILEQFNLDSCLCLRSRDHRQFVWLFFNWQEQAKRVLEVFVKSAVRRRVCWTQCL